MLFHSYSHKEVQTSLLFWDFTKRRVVVSYRRFGTAYRSHLQGSQLTLEDLVMKWTQHFIRYYIISSHRYESATVRSFSTTII